jgi:Flp pilus assembly protein TadD
MNDLEYRPRRIWNLACGIVAAIVVSVIVGFVLSGRPVAGRMANAPLSELETLYARRPTDNDVAYYYAHALAQKDYTDRAYQVMAEAVARDPRSTRLMTRLAQYAARRGHAVESVNLYRRINALDSSNANAHAELGHIFTEARLLTDALHEYDQAVKLDPKVEFDPALYARCLVHAGRDEEAWQQLVPFFGAIPRQDEPYEDLTKAGIKLGKFVDTQLLLTRRIFMDSEYPLCRFQYCEAQVTLAKPRTATTLKEAEGWAFASTHDKRATKEQYPYRGEYFALYGRVLEEEGRNADARAAILDGLKLDSTNKECLSEMVRVCERTRDPKVASWRRAYEKSTGENSQTESLRHTLAVNPHDSAAALALATTLERRGRLGEAEDLCFQVLSFAPQEKSATTILERCRAAALRRLEVEAKKTLADQ